jgi:HK97 gp10 family phage protein
MPSPVRTTATSFATSSGAAGHLKVYGVTETIRKLQLVGSMAGLQLGHLVFVAAQVMKERAEDYVPVVTGNLKTGIKGPVKVGKYDWIVTASSEAGTDPKGKNKNQKEYAHFVEFGTSKMSGRFFMAAAALDAEAMIRLELPVMARSLERL